LFGKFGQDAKDLFKKKYDFTHTSKFVAKTSTGGSIETSIVRDADSALRGLFKATVPVTGLGSFNGNLETEIHTVADKESKATYKIKGISQGVNVNLGAHLFDCKCDSKDFDHGWLAAEVEAIRGRFSGSIGTRSNGEKTLVDLTAVLGASNKLSLGAKATIDVASKEPPTDINIGAQVTGCDYTAAAYTEKKRSVVNVSYFQNLGIKYRPHNFGAILSLGLKKPVRSLTFGTDYWVDADTTVRASAKVSSDSDATILQTHVEHRLANPNVLLGVSAEFNCAPSNPCGPAKVGVSLTFGEF